ncbi:MAG: 3-dehydroquinate dehydratase [Gemmatimonadales bacterium]|nr:3-dehydroquinate dehydratase [Gemmatimonadales bacterium]
MKPFLVILGGPNLALLGLREPEIYGSTTWVELEEMCSGWAKDLGIRISFLQTDSEGELVSQIGKWGSVADGLILNAAAYTHTSIAVRDAVSAVSSPVVELHLTNPAAREDFRKRNLLEDVAVAGIRGFGVQGYRLAMDGLVQILSGVGKD